ncbi:hypothetical protein OG874_33265 [Nocardia sp. NBC_00565]|uniref:hypothetical protein n=1 Tax=Nocardia sp. NBC_00565 TaxID=2975993 RepID=UPI002E816D22|nr:hypothetical protein [Nocardia sp. NBC_00565]WUC01623.1 hypothetical protein OG874_33265 [Nocardia sp. NBC_00565]
MRLHDLGFVILADYQVITDREEIARSTTASSSTRPRLKYHHQSDILTVVDFVEGKYHQ